MTSRLNTRVLVTAVALDETGSPLQPLFRLCSVIYELDGSNLMLSALARLKGMVWVFLKWGCIRHLSVDNILPTFDGGRHVPSLEKSSDSEASK